ncbi:MAG: carbohydrate kinase family protein [Chloroflexota bacterium]|nr:carbohydrate kinase family protein [Chloroflexota bacterium]
MTIVVTGSVAFDNLLTYPGYFKDQILPEHIDKLSVSFLADTKESYMGGTGPNIAFSLALLGNRPKLMGAAGKDFAPFREWLEEKGVDTSAMGIFQDEFTATFTVLTDLDHNQIASFYTGAMARARELSLGDLGLDSEDLVIISPNDPEAMQKTAQECRELNVPFVYDPSQQLARMAGPELVESMQGARVLTVNEYEYEMVKQKSGLDEAAILDKVDVIVVTLGAKGSSVIGKDFRMEVEPANARQITEPTGVGDAYRAGLMTGMVHGFSWEVACRMASLAAVYVIEQSGTMNHNYHLDEFVERYRQEFGDAPELAELLASGASGV